MSAQRTIIPGYTVVQQPGTLDFQARLLYSNPQSEAARYFMQINRDTPWLKPGQMLIIADPQSENKMMLSQLCLAKTKVNSVLNSLSNDEADFFNRNYATIAALTNIMDKSLGVAGDAGERYFKEIETKLKAIETAYQNQFRTSGTLIGEQFVVERKRLFGELTQLLNKLSRLALKLKPYEDLRHALGLSSRSIVHEWTTAGVGGIKGYSTWIENAAKSARFMKMGGWVAIGFAGLNSTNEVYHACTAGRENECVKVAVKEYSKFGASVAGGIYGGTMGSLAAGAVCVALGVMSGGLGYLACSIVGAAAGGYLTGEVAGTVAGKSAEFIVDKVL
ncbi:hypothetical protein [Kosakonia oryziphila]|jgi:hypothetical protein|uniref:Uncharacterized protein n=1 Tax=Kosakonia oryziphila TaxID=1005667 RepID=A0A1C4AXU5_9ENTR|nr:hypothetical protein [Kosakonia oryziphila]SCB99407.1 hypothetical protein GA0061070_100624 [Kosakonia oryziphila]